MWNFSYLRNKIGDSSIVIPAAMMSRIFGNYFIVEFVFDNADSRRIEFEELNYTLSKT